LELQGGTFLYWIQFPVDDGDISLNIK
jgi:hypothetical protein